MNISLTPDQEQFIQSTVKRGKYSSASEVVGAALRLLEEREMKRLLRLEELRKEIAIGMENSDRGDIFDGEEVLKELREEIQPLSQSDNNPQESERIIPNAWGKTVTSKSINEAIEGM